MGTDTVGILIGLLGEIARAISHGQKKRLDTRNTLLSESRFLGVVLEQSVLLLTNCSMVH